MLRFDDVINALLKVIEKEDANYDDGDVGDDIDNGEW